MEKRFSSFDCEEFGNEGSDLADGSLFANHTHARRVPEARSLCLVQSGVRQIDKWVLSQAILNTVPEASRLAGAGQWGWADVTTPRREDASGTVLLVDGVASRAHTVPEASRLAGAGQGGWAGCYHATTRGRVGYSVASGAVLRRVQCCVGYGVCVTPPDSGG